VISSLAVFVSALGEQHFANSVRPRTTIPNQMTEESLALIQIIAIPELFAGNNFVKLIAAVGPL
jgi:hypothetical protein